MSIFSPKAARQIGRLAFDALTLARGEQITKRPVSQPHHSECPACGFDRWDGYSEHQWGGGRFAQRLCYGPKPTAEQEATRAAGKPSHPLVDELRGYASGVGEDLVEESPIEPEVSPNHQFEILGDARRQR